MSAKELLQSHFRTIRADPQAWRLLFATDAVLEMPFAPPHVPKVLKGIDSIAESVSGFVQLLGDDFEINQKSVHLVQGEDAVVAEFSMTATAKPTGKIYNQDYILYLRAEDGKIVFYREYFDGPRTAAAFTPDS
ncbi:hypothetical protein TrVFT333_009640 [Trichoderma virens FT-333]|nr:hypothetical protein TrVFT333_009640 [Trichoderma virens FT-333]